MLRHASGSCRILFPVGARRAHWVNILCARGFLSSLKRTLDSSNTARLPESDNLFLAYPSRLPSKMSGFDSDSDKDVKRAIAMSLQEPPPDAFPSGLPSENADFNSDIDEDTKRAIAMSLQEPSPEPRKSKFVDLVSEEEDDEDAPVTSRAPQQDQKMDIKNHGGSGLHTGSNNKIEIASSNATPLEIDQSLPMRKAPPPSNGILGSLNRKQMEEERRARLQSKQVESQGSNTELGSRKREAPTSPPAPHNRGGRQVMPRLSQEPTLGRDNSNKAASSDYSTTPTIPLSQEKNNLPNVLSFDDLQKTSAPGIQYPDGAIKKTWVHGCPRQGDDIKIEEVFQKNDLELAVLSSFQVDPAWVETKLDGRTNIIWVLQEKDESEVSENLDS